MRIIDTVPRGGLNKLILLDLGWGFSIFEQAMNRPPTPSNKCLCLDVAMDSWRQACIKHFASVTHNLPDAEALADRRIQSVFFER